MGDAYTNCNEYMQIGWRNLIGVTKSPNENTALD
jgi:hypothetical protein